MEPSELSTSQNEVDGSDEPAETREDAMDNFVYMYTHAVVWLNCIGALRKTESGPGHLGGGLMMTLISCGRKKKKISRREPDGRYVDHMRTL